MIFTEYAPVVVGSCTLDPVLVKSVKEKVFSYIDSADSKLESPKTEVVKTTFFTDCNILNTLELHELTNEIKRCALQHLDKFGDLTDEFVIHSWLNVFNKNSLELEHEHFPSYLSGVYYVDSDDTELSGCFVIPDHIRERNSYRKLNGYPLLTTQIIPITGTLLTFEPWMTHCVYANKVEKPRISIAFNIDRPA